MSEIDIRAARAHVNDLERDLEAARALLRRRLLAEQENGASIAQLMDWSGYQRRQVLNLLAAAKASR